MAADARLPFDAALDSVLSSLERRFILKKVVVKQFFYQEGCLCTANNRRFDRQS